MTYNKPKLTLASIVILLLIGILFIFGPELWSYILNREESKWSAERIEQDYRDYSYCRQRVEVAYKASVKNADQLTKSTVEGYNQGESECCTKNPVGCNEYVKREAQK